MAEPVTASTAPAAAEPAKPANAQANEQSVLASPSPDAEPAKVPEQNVLAQQLGEEHKGEQTPTAEQIEKNLKAKNASLVARGIGMLAHLAT